MTVDVLCEPLTDIEIGATGIREIIQNVRTIITTWRGELFLDRFFGIDTRVIDSHTGMLQANLLQDITAQVERYEPRVKVMSIRFTESELMDGVVYPLVTVQLREGALL